jgi:hypothetical protein
MGIGGGAQGKSEDLPCNLGFKPCGLAPHNYAYFSQ